MAVIRNASRSRQRGASQLETLGALAVGLLITVGSIALYTWYTDTQNESATADWLKAWSTGSAKYMNDNSAALIASNGGTFTMAQIAATGSGYFPLGFSNSSPYGQTATFTVTLNGGQPQGLVCASGGISLSDLARKRIAGKVGINGGYSPSSTPATIKGSQWGPVNLTSYGVAAGSCQLVAAQFVSTSTTMDDFLHRHNDGNPAHGQMNQNIDMNGNAIQNVTDVRTKAANQGITFFGGGEHIFGTADYGISFQTQSGIERYKIANDGTFYLGSGGANGRIDASGNIWLKSQASLLIGTSQFWADGSNVLLSSPAVNGTVYVRGGGVGNPWQQANLDVGGNVTAQHMTLPAGYTLQIGSSSIDGDGTNGAWVVGQPGGTFYIAGPGWSAANLAVNSNIQAGGNINASGSISASGTITSGQRMTSNEYVLPAGAAWDGNWCDTNGLIGRRSDGSGALMNCQNNTWVKLGGDSMNYYYMGQWMNQVVNGNNNTGKTMWIIVSNWGDNCGANNNDYGANIYVNGNMVGQNIDFNVNYAKVKTETFPVPAGGNYSVQPYRYICNVETRIWEYR